MITIHQIDTQSRAHVRRFVNIPYRLYAGHPQWVPPLLMDAKVQLDRRKHPFYEHSTADFFIATRDGRDVGRIAALENRRFNDYHSTHQAQFYLFECEDDPEAANALFERVFEWARGRGLDHVVGPKGFGVLDGYGILVEGYQHRQMMTMMNYNYDYYPRLVEAQGFQKEVDFVSCYLDAETFHLPERIHRLAERVKQRGNLAVKRFHTKRELLQWAGRIGQTYNQAFVNNWEYYPLTEREIEFLVQNLMMVADARLIKLITHGDDVVGFLFAFPDVSAALQRARGHLLPFGLPDLLLEMRRTRWVALNGAGILPEFQGRGGNTLLYTEMENSMRHDLENLGGKPYKNHRVYVRHL